MACEHTPGDFCKTCHCRKIARERDCPEYRARRQAGLDRWSANRAATFGLTFDEQKLSRAPQNKTGLPVSITRKIVVKSRPTQEEPGP